LDFGESFRDSDSANLFLNKQKIRWDSIHHYGEVTNPGGTAMPGQLVIEPEQAPEVHPLAKISLIPKKAHGPRIRY
jgi:hypothetical protein